MLYRSKFYRAWCRIGKHHGVNHFMTCVDERIIKEMLLLIKSREIFGFEILNTIKDNNQESSDTIVYSSLKFLEKNGYVTSFKRCDDGNCCVKIRYCLSEKGQKMLNTLS